MHYTEKFLAAFAPIEAAMAEWEASGQSETDEVPEEIRIAFRDAMLSLGHLERVRNLYRVQDKLSRKAAFFRPNSRQESYLATKKGRDVILKIRQVGFTTLSCIRALDYALWEPNYRTGIMAHQQNVVATIFEDIVKFTHSYFKKDWSHLYRPTERSDASNTLAFRDDGLGRELNSSMRVLFDFRGKTVPFLHVSEASRIEPERLLGSLQGVPANGEVILESTPNGRGGEFYRQWQNWRTMNTLAPYKGHFVPWYTFYPEEPEKWELPPGTELTPYEQALMKEYDGQITESHIAWRRWCIEANCLGDPEKFENEYPTNDVDCWFSGENLVFNSSILKYQDRFVCPPSKIGFLLSDGARLALHTDPKGILKVWKEPKVGRAYVLGADAAGGVGKDPAVAVVLDRQTGETVATLAAQLDPTEFGNEVYKLANWYNKAWVNPESNNHGHTVIHVLKEKQYKSLYKRKVIDNLTNKPTSVVGFLTTSDSKLLITEKMKDRAKDGSLKVLDNEILTEMSTFVQIASKTGKSIKREASAGSHDDRVMATALAIEMDNQRGVFNLTEEEDSAIPEEYEFDQDTGMTIPF
jgi:hypothetical protein